MSCHVTMSVTRSRHFLDMVKAESLALLRCFVNNMAAGGNEHGSRCCVCTAHLLHINERWLAYQYRSGGQPFEVPDRSADAYPSQYSSQYQVTRWKTIDHSRKCHFIVSCVSLGGTYTEATVYVLLSMVTQTATACKAAWNWTWLWMKLFLTRMQTPPCPWIPLL